MTAVIIANGSYPRHAIPLAHIERAEFIVCCDGAADDFIRRGGRPDAIVGDCDSISPENKNRFANILFRESEQETNDLSKAVRFCVARGKTDLIIVAATGKREDHTLGNISLLLDYRATANVKMITDYGTFTPIDTYTEFSSFPGQTVSIFSFDPLPLTFSGLLYPVENRVLTNWWQGTLNASTGTVFSIDTQGRVVVFQAFPE